MTAEALDATDTLSAALWAASRGFRVHPLDHPSFEHCIGMRTREHDPAACAERGKHPVTKWSEHASDRADVVASDFIGMTRNVGLALPPGRIVIDEDRPGGLAAAARDAGASVPETLQWNTGRGTHYVFALPKGVIHGNETGRLKSDYGCDVRGRGGYVVGPGSTHVTGVLYMVDDPAAEIAPAPEWLMEVITTKPTTSATTGEVGAFGGLPEVIPGPRAGSGGDRHAVLVSYACSLRARSVPMDEAEVLFLRAWGRCEQPPACLSALTWDEAKGKLHDVYKRYPEGHSAEFKAPDVTVLTAPEPPAATDGDAQGDNDGGDAPLATWGRVDLSSYLAGTHQAPEPTLMPRSDGVHLLYPGLTHSFHGESESGKSWVAQVEAARCIKLGLRVLYVDFESDAASIVERFLALGCTREQIAEYLDYRQPEASPASAHELEAWQDMLSGTYVLAVIDGVTDAMGLFGKKTADNDEISAWMRVFPRQLARRTGAAVVMIDHVTKDKDTRGRFAIGGQAKMAGLTGAAYTVDVVEGLGKGLRGVLSIRVAKDRPGSVRGKAGPMRRTDRTQEIARFILDSTSPHLAPDLAPWVGANGEQPPEFRPTGIMEKVSRLIETSPGMNKGAIEETIQGRREWVRLAVDVLVREGFVRADPAGRGAYRHHSLKPFRELYQPKLGTPDE